MTEDKETWKLGVREIKDTVNIYGGNGDKGKEKENMRENRRGEKNGR